MALPSRKVSPRLMNSPNQTAMMRRWQQAQAAAAERRERKRLAKQAEKP